MEKENWRIGKTSVIIVPINYKGELLALHFITKINIWRVSETIFKEVNNGQVRLGGICGKWSAPSK